MTEYLAGAAAMAIVSAAGYQSMAPTAQWFGRTFTGSGRHSREIALTFDDGPNDVHTPRLLEVLAKHNVQATFFMIGRYVELFPDVAREVAQSGHVIGNHTFTHPNLIFTSGLQTRIQLQECDRALSTTIGPHSSLFRPPFGGRLPHTLRIARSLNLLPVMWNVTGWDWNAPSADYVEEKISKQLRGGDVILMHDGSHASPDADRAHTVTATDRLIRRYKAEGFHFVTIPQMMQNSPAFQPAAAI